MDNNITDPDHLVMTVMRAQPPSAGHAEIANMVKDIAHLHGAHHLIYGSPTEGNSDNPIPGHIKEQMMKDAFGTDNVFVGPSPHLTDEEMRSGMPPKPRGLLGHIKHAHDLGFKRLTVVVGGDERKRDLEKIKRLYIGKVSTNKRGETLDLSGIKHFDIVTLPRDTDSASGSTEITHDQIDPKTQKMKLQFVSGSKMRKAAMDRDLGLFHSMLPSHITKRRAAEMMDTLRQHMKQHIKEDVSALTRLKLAKAARRTAARRKITRRNRAKKRRNIPQLKIRAKNEIISQLRRKVYKGNWKKLSYSQRANIDKNIARKRKLVGSMIKRIMPQVIKGESERLKRINSSFDPVIDNFTANFLSEAKRATKVKREPLDHSEKAARRRDNTNSQRGVRARSDEAIKSGNIRGQVLVAKNKKTGDLEIISKRSYNKKTHDIIVGAEDVTKGGIKSFLNDAGFVNTKTSIALFGSAQKNAGSSKTKNERPAEEKKEKKKKTTKKAAAPKQSAAAQQMLNQLQMPNMAISPEWTMPKNKQQRGFKASDQEFAIASNLEYLLNNKKPEDLIKNGMISEDDHNMMVNNQNLQQSALRAAQSLIKELGLQPGQHEFFATGRMRQQLSEAFRAVGATDTTMKSDLVIVNKDGSVYGVSVKYGASQLGSPKEKELKGIMQTSWERTREGMSKGCQKSTKDFIDNKLTAMADGIKLPGTVGAVKKNVGGYAESNPKLKKQVDIAIKANKDMQKDWDRLMETCSSFTDAVTRELMTGEGKFAGTYTEEIFKRTGKKVNAGVATHVLSINEDGRSSSLDAIDGKMLQKIKPDLKYYIAMKTTDCGSTEQMKFYKTDFKPKLIESAQKGKRKDFEKLVKVAQGEFKRQGVAPPKFTKKDIDTFMEQARDGSVANALKFKKHCSKSAFRVGKPGESSEEEIEESIISCFYKRYIAEGDVATTSIAGDPVYDDEDLQLTNINPDPEDLDADAWLDYTRQYIGDDLFKFLDFMGIDFDSMSTSEVNFGEMFTNPQSSRTNLVYINGQPKYIPVFDADAITEAFLIERKKKRNYKQEYERYHSRPEQRKNRSKRVLARRLMMKLGKVHKGDGKDVDHKDGNPQNNGKHNLRVRDKSENRADN